MKKKWLKVSGSMVALFAICMLTMGASGDGCDNGGQTDYGSNTFGTEARITEYNQQALDKAQPQPRLQWSLERDNIIKRTKMWNDPNKIGYITLFTQQGMPIAHYVIKGKVSSLNSTLSDPEQLVSGPSSSSYEVVSSPQEDGSYGDNGQGIYFFTTDGAYKEWNGPYLLSDTPDMPTTKPIMIQATK